MSRELMLERIESAQKHIDSCKEKVKLGRMRQHYHLMPEVGWMNDPNGLIYFRGKYHFFYQTNPYSAFWDSMHWGHAVSEDLVHWEYMPIALAPSEVYDDYQKGGCFSGSAIEYDGKLFLIYTGTANRGRGSEQAQCLAWSEDGIHFEKYLGNPVVEAPEGIDPGNFRDPKVWKHENYYYMVVGTQKDGRGMALIYRAEDLFHWEFLNVLAESRGEWGSMWECPDFFPLEDKFVLTCSPIGSGDHTSVYMVGDFDYKTGKFDPHISGEMDWGFDYYAPQSFLAPDGRRIIAAWANGWEWMPLWKDWGPTYREGWCGFFALPREASLDKDGRLRLIPVRELQSIRDQKFSAEEIAVDDNFKELTAGDGILFEMQFEIDLCRSNADKLELKLRAGEGRETVCSFDFKRGELRVDRNNADGWSRGVSRSTMLYNGREVLDVHIFSDRSSLEIFTDEYRANHANNIYAGSAQNQIYIRAHGGNVILKNFKSYSLKG